MTPWPRAGCSARTFAAFIIGLILAAAFGEPNAPQVVPGPNVNVLGGPTFIELAPFDIVGDPWRNEQAEPHCAVSSRNPAVIVCSAVAIEMAVKNYD